MGNTFAEYLVKKFTHHEESKEEKSKEGEDRFIKWLSDLSKESIPIAGGKGANLAEMYNAKMPVPPAFVIVAQAYEHFIKFHGLNEKIKKIIEGIDTENTAQLEARAREIRDMIIKEEMPDELKNEIVEAYDNLNIDPSLLKVASRDALSILKVSREPCFVAVRSSATTEDLSTASFAGQQETFLNVKGNAELLESVKKCFASLFTARAVYYRKKRGFEHEKSLIAVVVQKMVNSDESGVIFTINPLNNAKEIVIEAVFGLGEGIVSGTIMPDNYVVAKEDLAIKAKEIGKKELMFTRNSGGKTIKETLQPTMVTQQVLSESEIKQLANYAMSIEQHYKVPQDIEFAIESGNVYIVQTRPVTTLDKKVEEKGKIDAEVILQGLAASAGIASGTVKIIYDLKDLDKIKKGDVLVTKMTNPDMVVSMQKATAIVTDEGGVTAHAAIVSREMGIPCVVGTKKATSLLKDGMTITVNGTEGRVYEGAVKIKAEIKEILPVVKTRTEIKVIVDLPDFAERAAKTNAAGVGLLRLEDIIASNKKHPSQYMRENNLQVYTELLADGIRRIAKFFPSKPIWVRTSDIRTDEFQHLEGAPAIETNPMLGLHGIRYSLKYPEILKAEFLAVKKVVDEGHKIGIMLPQVISVEEARDAKRLMHDVSLETEFGVMVETPAAVEILKDLFQYIEFISIGSNDLTQYTLAIDRGNEGVQYLYDEMNPAVLSLIARTIEECKKYAVKSSICGQAGSKPEMAKFLVEKGIDSISVNADAAFEISKLVAGVEEQLDEKHKEGEKLTAAKEAADEGVAQHVEREHAEELHEELERAGLKEIVNGKEESNANQANNAGSEEIKIDGIIAGAEEVDLTGNTEGKNSQENKGNIESKGQKLDIF